MAKLKMNQITLAILALRDFLLEHVTTLRWERKAGGIGLRVSQIFVLLEYEIVRWNVRIPNPKSITDDVISPSEDFWREECNLIRRSFWREECNH